MAKLEDALRKLQEAEAQVRQRKTKARYRIDVHHAGQPMPTWPNKRPADLWLLIEVPA